MEYFAVQKIIYCKVDCFFTSIEVNNDPSLRFPSIAVDVYMSG